jgi:hypothetical protein
MSLQDDRMIFEQYCHGVITETAPVPAPAPAPAPAAAPAAAPAPAGPVTADSVAANSQITRGDQQWTVGADWVQGSGAVDINLTDQMGRPVPMKVADLNAEFAAGTAALVAQEPAAAPEGQRSSAIAPEKKGPETAAWAKGAGAVLGTDTGAAHIGGGVKKGISGNDWLTRGAVNLVGGAVKKLGQKAAPRADAAVAHQG